VKIAKGRITGVEHDCLAIHDEIGEIHATIDEMKASIEAAIVRIEEVERQMEEAMKKLEKIDEMEIVLEVDKRFRLLLCPTH
jgi:chromosome segregation ATPase